jgi:putative CocE/NonD family hydrolase
VSIGLRLARRWLALPPARFASASSTEWVPLSDGTRLATTIVRPVGTAGTAPESAVLVRTPHPADGRALSLARIVAENGHVVVLQECRGRHRSEGRFEAFRDEVRDGAEAIAWLRAQAWFGGRLGLAGIGYAGHAAWAALSAAPDVVDALVVGFAARDPYAWLHAGGALQLELALALAAITSGDAPGGIDLVRAAQHRPVREADRVALRHSDAFRSWVDHPSRDAWWRALEPTLPERPPAALLVAGWDHPALGAQLSDYAVLAAAPGRRADPELLVGPWSAAPVRVGRRRPENPLGAGLRALLAFLDRRLGRAEGRSAPVRVYVRGAGRWREAAAWPPPGAELARWYLHGPEREDGGPEGGALRPAPPSADAAPDHYVYDPASATPAAGGARLAAAAGPADQGGVEARADVLCFTSDPLASDLEVTGPVRVVLFAASDAPDTDFAARLTVVDASGGSTGLCEGIARMRWREGGEAAAWLEAGRCERVEIDLWATGHRLRAGERMRLQISSAIFPRFDRNANARIEPARAEDEDGGPARQTVFHDAERASHLLVPTVPI